MTRNALITVSLAGKRLGGTYYTLRATLAKHFNRANAFSPHSNLRTSNPLGSAREDTEAQCFPVSCPGSRKKHMAFEFTSSTTTLRSLTNSQLGWKAAPDV